MAEGVLGQIKSTDMCRKTRRGLAAVNAQSPRYTVFCI